MDVSQLKSLFTNFDEEDFEYLKKVSVVENHEKNDVLIQEGKVEEFFYVILSGKVKICKHDNKKTFLLTILEEMEPVGEMALFESVPRSAEAVCITPVQALKVDMRQLKQGKQKKLFLKLCQLFGNKISKRLRYINEVTVASFKEKLAMGSFAINIIAMTALYTLALQGLAVVKKHTTNSTGITIAALLLFCYFIFNMMARSGYPLSAFGITGKGWKKSLWESTLLTLPILGLIVGIKYFILNYYAQFHNLPLFDPAAIFQGKHDFSLEVYLLALSGYIIFVPLQELIVRGGIQSALQKFMTGSPRRITWGSIFVSNLIFAAGHSHISRGFVLSVFLPGLFWGWLFTRHKSLIGVSFSHILIGVWAAFIVGFENIF